MFSAVRRSFLQLCIVSSICAAPGLAQCLQWNNVTPPLPGPEPRHRAAVTYDSNRDSILVFGGMRVDSTALGDTWEFRNGAWTPVATTGPSLRKLS